MATAGWVHTCWHQNQGEWSEGSVCERCGRAAETLDDVIETWHDSTDSGRPVNITTTVEPMKPFEIKVTEEVEYTFKLYLGEDFDEDDLAEAGIDPNDRDAIIEWLEEDSDRQVITDNIRDENFDAVIERSVEVINEND